MKEVKLVDGKFVQTGEKAKGNGGRPPKYPYPTNQYSELLAIARGDGIEVGETRAKNTQSVNTMTGLILSAFIADRRITPAAQATPAPDTPAKVRK